MLLVHSITPLHPVVVLLRPLHPEWLLMGWVVQLALGVAYWILPRFGSARHREGWAVAAVVLLNLGVWMAGVGATWRTGTLPVEFVGRIAEGTAAAAFAVHAWPRIKPARSHE